MFDIKNDKTDTRTHDMTGNCPFGGDRIGGALGTPPALSDWYPDRLKVELLHQNCENASNGDPPKKHRKQLFLIPYQPLGRGYSSRETRPLQNYLLSN